jgi:phage terminase large subunit
VARTSRRENPESLAGFHSPHMLFVVEEASGVPNVIFETASGALSTPGAKIIMAGNPTRSDGYFYDAFHSDRDKWHCITVSCEEGDYVDPKFIDEMAAKYGAESNVFRVRVLGEFPTQSDDVLLPLHLVEEAVTRDVEAGPTTPVVWGLDVARFGGDRSALAKRQGNVLVEPIKTWQNKDLMELAGIVLSEYDAVPYSKRPIAIYIDAIGLGAGLADRLRELDMPAVAVSVSETASLKDRFNRLRDELFWSAREWFEARDCKIPSDDTLIAELTGIRYKYLSTGKLKVESKDEMKRRGQRSPDVADAFVLSFAGQGAVAGGYSRGYNHNRSLKPKNSWVV